jgi:hypothetical protein
MVSSAVCEPLRCIAAAVPFAFCKGTRFALAPMRSENAGKVRRNEEMWRAYVRGVLGWTGLAVGLGGVAGAAIGTFGGPAIMTVCALGGGTVALMPGLLAGIFVGGPLSAALSALIAPAQ